MTRLASSSNIDIEVAWIQGTHGSARGGNSDLTATLNGVAAQHLVIVGLVLSDPAGPAHVVSVGDRNRNQYHLAVQGDNAGARGSLYAAIFYSIVETPGDVEITAEFSRRLAGTSGLALAEYSGSAILAPVDGAGFRAGHSSTPSVGTTGPLEHGGQLVFAIYGNNDEHLTPTAGDGHYVREVDLGVQLLTETTKAMTANPVVASFGTMVRDHDWVCAVVTFKPIAGNPAPNSMQIASEDPQFGPLGFTRSRSKQTAKS